MRASHYTKMPGDDVPEVGVASSQGAAEGAVTRATELLAAWEPQLLAVAVPSTACLQEIDALKLLKYLDLPAASLQPGLR